MFPISISDDLCALCATPLNDDFSIVSYKGLLLFLKRKTWFYFELSWNMLFTKNTKQWGAQQAYGLWGCSNRQYEKHRFWRQKPNHV